MKKEERLERIGKDNLQLMESRLRSLLGQRYNSRNIRALAHEVSNERNIKLDRLARRSLMILKAWLYENWGVIGDAFTAKATMLTNN